MGCFDRSPLKILSKQYKLLFGVHQKINIEFPADKKRKWSLGP